ncbi:MAG: SdrD B-like domain-containing protein, partial [Candidatus Methanoperedens sp.]|nr:SdrD B-like domain-containing protein [Candidatus Methanoperedens sp.]
MSRRKMWRWQGIEIVIALFLLLLIASEVSAYIYSPLQSISFGPNTGIIEKDTAVGVFYHDNLLDFSNPLIYGMNSQNKKVDDTNKAPESKKDKQNDGTNKAPEPKKDKQNDGTNNAPEPKKDKQNDGTNKASEPKKDKNTDEKKLPALEIKNDKKPDETRCLSCNGSISGYKINDTDGDGIWDQGEGVIAGWTIKLKGKDGIKITDEISTDVNGSYSFDHLPAGEYTVEEEEDKDWRVTRDHKIKITLTDGANSTNNNFFNMLKKSIPIGTGSISGYKINDTDGDGNWTPGEMGIANWSIKLDQKDGKHIRMDVVTDATGYYIFNDLPAGEYKIKEEKQKEWKATGDTKIEIELEDGENSTNNNFTNMLKKSIPVGTGGISGYKINDTNGNGIWDEWETGIAGWKIFLIGQAKNHKKNNYEDNEENDYENDGVEELLNNENIKPSWSVNLLRKGRGNIKLETETNRNGYYEFTDLPDGKYDVKEEMQNDWVHTSSVVKHIEIEDGDIKRNVNFTNKLKKSLPPSDSIAPVINNVTLNTTTPFIGQLILVTVNATDNIGVTAVTANGTALTDQGGNIWNGTIIAQAGNHSV